MTHPEEKCHRCQRPNLLSWSAPSPLWNAVMRQDGKDDFDGIVCPTCFADLAEQRGVVHRGIWTLDVSPRSIAMVLPTHDADGRVWNPEKSRWVEEK